MEIKTICRHKNDNTISPKKGRTREIPLGFYYLLLLPAYCEMPKQIIISVYCIVIRGMRVLCARNYSDAIHVVLSE